MIPQEDMKFASLNPSNKHYRYTYPFIPMGEEFRNISIYIPELKDYYWISNYGRIYNSNTGYLVTPFTNFNGYTFYVLYRTKEAVEQGKYPTLTVSAHILVCTCFNGPKPGPDYQVNHIDFIRHNNYYQNLEWLTGLDNIRYSIDAGHTYNGNEHFNAIYKEEQVRQVCELLQAGLSKSSEISNIIFGYSDKSTCDFVRSIKLRRSWNNISKDYPFDETSYGRQFMPETLKLMIIQFIDSHPELANATYSQILAHMGFVVKGMNDKLRKQYKFIIANAKRPGSYKSDREKLKSLPNTPPMYTLVDPESGNSLDQ